MAVYFVLGWNVNREWHSTDAALHFASLSPQGDQSDTLIWGFTDTPDVEVLVEVACNGQQQTTLLRADPSGFKKASRKADGDVWEVTYPNSQENGQECAITVTQGRIRR